MSSTKFKIPNLRARITNDDAWFPFGTKEFTSRMHVKSIKRVRVSVRLRWKANWHNEKGILRCINSIKIMRFLISTSLINFQVLESWIFQRPNVATHQRFCREREERKRKIKRMKKRERHNSSSRRTHGKEINVQI